MASASMDILVEAIDEASNTFEEIEQSGQQSAKTIESEYSNASDSIEEADTSAQGFSTTLKTGLLVSVTAVASAIGGLTYELGQYADEILDASAFTGVHTQALQEWRVIADMAGVSTEVLERAQYRLNRQMSRGEKGSAMLRRTLEDLGITYEYLAEASPEQRMEILIDRLQSIEDDGKRAQAGMALFRGSYRDLAPIIAQTNEQMDEAIELARESGIVMGEDALKGADNWRRALVSLKTELQGAGRQIANALMPVINNSLVPALENKIVPAIRTIRNSIVTVIGLFSEFGGQIKSFVKTFVTFIALFKGLPLVLSAVGKALGLIVGLLSWKIILIGAVISALSLFISSNEKVRDALGTAWDGIQKIILTVLNAIIRFMQAHAETMWDIVDSLMQILMKGIYIALREIIRITTFNLAVLSVLWERYGDDIRETWDFTWGMILGITDNIVSAVLEVIEGLMALGDGDWEDFTQHMKNAWDELWSEIDVETPEWIQSIQTKISDFINEVKNIWNSIELSVKDWLEPAGEVWDDYSSELTQTWKDEEKSLAEKLAGSMSLTIDFIIDIGKLTWEWAGETFPGAKEWVQGVYTHVKESIKDFELEDILIPLGAGIDWTVQDLMPDITESVSAVRGTIQDLSDEFRLEDEEIMDIGTAFKDAISKDTDLSDAEMEMSTSIWDFVVGIYNMMKEVIGLVFFDIPELIATAIARGMQEVNLLELGAWMAGRLIRGFADLFLPGFIETIEETFEIIGDDDMGIWEKIKSLTGLWRDQILGDMDDLEKEMQDKFEEKYLNNEDLEQELQSNLDIDLGNDLWNIRTPQAQASEISLSEQDKKDIALMTRLEAGGESFEGQAGVAQVILNRLESNLFPDNVEDVLTQPGQFEPVEEWKKLRNTNIDLSEQLQAVEKALRDDIVGDATFFANLEIVEKRDPSNWFLTEDYIELEKIGGHSFGVEGYKDGTPFVPGRGRGDRVPAMLEPGEAVVPRNVVRGGIDAIANWFRNAQGYQSGTTGDYEEQAGVVKIPVIGNILQDILAEHDELYNAVMGELDPIFEEAEDKWKNIDENAREVIENIQDMDELEPKDLEEFMENIKGLGEELEGITDIESDLPDLEDLGEGIEIPENRPENFFEAISQGIRQNLPLLDKFINEWQYMVTSLKGLEEEGELDLSGLMNNLKDKAIEIAPDFVINLGQSIKQGLSGLGQSLSSFLGPQIMSALGPIGTFVGMIIGESEQFKNIMQTIQPLIQAVANMFGALIAPLEPIINLLTWLSPIFETLGMILATIVEPIFRALFPVIKLVGLVFNRLAWAIQHIRRITLKAFLALAKGIDSIPFVSASGAIRSLQKKIRQSNKNIDDLNESYDEMKDMTYDNAKAKEEEKEKTEELNDQLRNAPEIFNRAFARAEVLRGQNTNQGSSTSSSSSSGKIDTSSSNTGGSSGKAGGETISIEKLIVNINGVDDPREQWRKLKKVIREETYNKLGFTKA